MGVKCKTTGGCVGKQEAVAIYLPSASALSRAPPEIPAARLSLAVAPAELKRPGEAETELQETRRIDPNYAEAGGAVERRSAGRGKV